MPKRILYVQGISKIGGAEKDLIRLLERLDRQQFEPYVVCPSDGPLAGELERLKVSVLPMELPPWRKLKGIFSMPSAIWKLLKRIKDLRIDLVHVNDYWWGPISYIASRIANVPCVVHIRQEIEPRRVKQYWFKKPQKMIAVSNRIRNTAIDAGVDSSRITVIYSGIDTSLTASADQVGKVRERYKLTDSQPVIGTVANLFARKGHEYLLEALVEVRRKIPDVHCLIVGEGDASYTKMLFDGVKAKDLNQVVSFTGFQKDIAAHIAAMNIFVLPSLLEGFGIVLIEAMLMGKPVVATTVGGIPEVVQDQVTGFLVASRDSHALAKNIIYLLENPPVAQKMGRAGRTRVLERFSIEQMVSKLQNLYSELAKSA